MQHLIVIVPGIGGSVLADPQNRNEIVWDAGLADLAGLPFNHDRLNVEEHPRLKPRGLVTTTKLQAPGRFLRWIPGWTVVHGYEELFDRLAAEFPDATIDRGDEENPNDDADIVGFAYDFRLGIVDAAEQLDIDIRRRLNHRGSHDKAQKRRVILVAHSMGGLVARQWAGCMQDDDLCRSVITLGTPHRGSPKALDMLVNGPSLGPIPLPSPLRDTLRGWPGVYDLLPTYRAIGPPQSDAIDGMTGMYAHKLPSSVIGADALRAFEMHQQLASAWNELPRGRPEMVAYYGHTHPTSTSAHWNSETQKLSTSKTHPTWVKAPGWEHTAGDGTVPAIASIPKEMSLSAQATERTGDRHGPIATSNLTITLIKHYEELGDLGLVASGETKSDVALGLDLRDAYPAGEDIVIEATLSGQELAAEAEIWARFHPDKRIQLELTADHGTHRTYQAVLKCPSPGFRRLDLQAQKIGTAADRSVSDWTLIADL